MTEREADWDYVIIGGGAAGCVIANRLSADPSMTVLLLEAGGTDKKLSIRVPALEPVAHARYNWNYEAEPDASRCGLRDVWSGGKVLGGGTSISGQIFVRGHREDYDAWAASGCTGWDYESVLPHFKDIETFERGGDAFRGGAGPMRCSYHRVEHPTIDAFIESARAYGFPFNDDYNAELQEGVSLVQAYQKDGMRHNSGYAFIHPVEKRPNLKIVLNAFVTRIRFDRSSMRATAVEYLNKDGQVVAAHCNQEIVLSAGAIATPKILMLSGIGPEDELRRHDIEVLLARSEIGQNLEEHPSVTMRWRSRVPTFNARPSRKNAYHLFEYLVHRKGPISTPTPHAQVFFSNPNSADHAKHPGTDIQLYFQAMGYALDQDPRTGRTTVRFSKEPTISALICVLHPEFRGSIGLRSSNALDPPVIRHQLLGGGYERVQLLDGLRIAREIFDKSALRRYASAEVSPGVDVTTDDDLASFVRTSAWRGDHPACTCRMGSSDEAVVDPELRVRGVAGLRIADASVMPTLVSGNTTVPCTMIGEKAAALIRASADSR